ncbi:MAG: response regulator [Acidobacteriales bacterium]|nr:response regulator [Terriglobales bacterium]
MARKILLADDSVTAQNMGRKILSDAGYEIVTVNNGSAALKKIAEINPDLIILDVYMPGYSGLEVCQKVKDNRETSRIPVLLTVGKLEPFKADEAKRVGADAHVVKPFEASELLTILSRLEDKIVPRPEAFKPGRFAKAIAAVEGSAAVAKTNFGSADTGWHNRLIIPAASPKPDDTNSALAATVAPEARGTTKDQNSDAATVIASPVMDVKSAERKSPESYREMIPPAPPTPEEMAAMAAVAASFIAGQGTGATHTSESDRTPAADEKENPTKAPSAPQITGDSGNLEPPVAANYGADAIDGEVSEALASLSPRRSDFAAPAFSVPAGLTVPADANREHSVATSSSAASAALRSGSRWIAEQVPVAALESSVVLEQEMEAAFAALSTASTPISPLTPPARAAWPVGISSSGNGRPHADSATHRDAQAEESLTALPSFASGDAEQGNGAVEPQTVAGVSQIAADVQSQDVEFPAVLDTRAHEVSGNSRSSKAASDSSGSTDFAATAVGEYSGSSETAADDVPVDTSVLNIHPDSAAAASEPSEMASAAAAASSSVTAYSTTVSLPTSSNEANASSTPVEVTPQAQEEEQLRAPELAAAWHNWKQIRDSILTASSKNPDASAAGFHEIERGAAAAAQAASTQATVAEATTDEADASAIADIVDSVLAEMKPKLMEQIAKKMAKEKEKRK